MSRAATSVFRSPKLVADAVFAAADLVAVIETWRGLKKAIFDPYRPELHYMRGPGPKWHEKRRSELTGRAPSVQREISLRRLGEP